MMYASVPATLVLLSVILVRLMTGMHAESHAKL